MDKSKAIELLQKQIDEINKLESKGSQKFKDWEQRNIMLLNNLLKDKKHYLNKLKRVKYKPGTYINGRPIGNPNSIFKTGLSSAKAILLSAKEEIETFWEDNEYTPIHNEPLDNVLKICNRFHTVARTMKNKRHNNRATIIINDEYDVQDLLHSLLKIDFEDVRPEDCTPSYAGSSSRIDFILRDEKIAIEVKMTRKGLKDKEVGEQLIIDIARYKTHQDCKTLVCFVYDPGEFINNPVALENDLTKKEDGLNIITVIKPKAF